MTAKLLGMDEEQFASDKIGDVKLLMDKDNLDAATIVVLKHGPLPECTWLNCIPVRYIKAWIRLGGQDWQKVWRTFDQATISGIRGLKQRNDVDI